MKFVGFLKQLDRKRLRAKRLVTYGIYLLAPIVIAATAFSNDRIITKCEEIEKMRLEYAEKLKNCGTQDISLSDEVTRLKDENRRLRNQTSAPTPSGPDPELSRARRDIKEAERTNENLRASLARTQNQLDQLLRRDSLSRSRSDYDNSQVDFYKAEVQRVQRDYNNLVRTSTRKFRAKERESADYQKKYLSCTEGYRILQRSRNNQPAPENDNESDCKKRYDKLFAECQKLRAGSNNETGRNGKPTSDGNSGSVGNLIDGLRDVIVRKKVEYRIVKYVPSGYNGKIIFLKGQALRIDDNGGVTYVKNQ